MESLKIFIYDTNKARLLINCLMLEQSLKITVVGNAYDATSLYEKIAVTKPDIILLNNDTCQDKITMEKTFVLLNNCNCNPKVLFMHDFLNNNDTVFIQSDLLCDYNQTVNSFAESIMTHNNRLNYSNHGNAA